MVVGRLSTAGKLQSKKGKIRLWVLSVFNAAKQRAGKDADNWAEEELLLDILIAEAWIAAQAYDSSKSKFITWVYRPWSYSTKDFWRAKRLSTQPIHNSEGSRTLEDTVEDNDTPSPIKAVLAAEQKAMVKAAFLNQQQLRFLVDTLWHQGD